LFSDKSLYFVR